MITWQIIRVQGADLLASSHVCMKIPHDFIVHPEQGELNYCGAWQQKSSGFS